MNQGQGLTLALPAQATFTFVVRSFTVLDGIGKCLDPRFDISEIAAPYARELLLEGRPQVAKLRSELGKRLALQARRSASRPAPACSQPQFPATERPCILTADCRALHVLHILQSMLRCYA